MQYEVLKNKAAIFMHLPPCAMIVNMILSSVAK